MRIRRILGAGRKHPDGAAHQAPRNPSGQPRSPANASAATARRGAGPLSWLARLFPDVRPYPPGEGDADGLSRNIEDCNKGCIDNPIR